MAKQKKKAKVYRERTAEPVEKAKVNTESKSKKEADKALDGLLEL